MSCTVPKCCSRADVFTKNNQNVSFHRFPADLKLRSAWVKNIRKGNSWWPSKYTRICSLHFEDSCFREGYERRTLHSTAVPTIFPNLPPSRQSKVSRKRKKIVSAASTSTDEDVHVNNEESDEEQKVPPKRKKSIPKYGSSGARASTSTDEDVHVNNEESDEEQKVPPKKNIAKYGSSGARASTSTDEDVDVNNEESDEEQKVLQKFIAIYDSSGARASTSTDEDVQLNNEESDEEQHGGSLPKIHNATQTENHDEPDINTELLKKTKLLNRYKELAVKRGRKLKNEQRKCSRYAKKIADLETIILTLYKKMESENNATTLENTLDTDNHLNKEDDRLNKNILVSTNKEHDRLNTNILECTNEEDTTFIDDSLTEKETHLYLEHNLVKDSDWKCSWSTGGKVFIKKGEGEPAIEIKSQKKSPICQIRR